jgi:hypothetical protein
MLQYAGLTLLTRLEGLITGLNSTVTLATNVLETRRAAVGSAAAAMVIAQAAATSACIGAIATGGGLGGHCYRLHRSARGGNDGSR